MSEDPTATPSALLGRLDEQLDADPFAAGLDEALTVAGDLLQARGDRRGELIVLEQAIARAPDRRARAEQLAIRERWIWEHGAELFGEPFAAAHNQRGALQIATRGGRLRSLTVDLRRIDPRGREPAQALTRLLGSPGARWLVELRVRVRTEPELRQVDAALAQVADGPPLELVIASTTTRPLAAGASVAASDLRQRYPRLWFATQLGRVAPIVAPGFDDRVEAARLRQRPGEPMSADLRVAIGRGLTSSHEATTLAACALLAGLGGSAQVFLPALRTLLQPGVSAAARWLVPALPSCGPWVDALVPQLARISSCRRRYPPELRSLAGHALAARLR